MTNFARCFQIIIVTRAMWSDMGVRPETDTLTPKFVAPQISRLGSHKLQSQNTLFTSSP